MYFPDLIRDFQQQELTEVNYHFKRLYGVNLPSFFIPTIQEEFNLTLEKAVEFHQSKVEPSNEDLGDYIEKIRNISTIKVPQVSQSGIPLPNNESVTNAGHLVHKARLFFYIDLLDRESIDKEAGQFRSYEEAILKIFFIEDAYFTAIEPILDAISDFKESMIIAYKEDPKDESTIGKLEKAEEFARNHSINKIFG